MGRSRAKHVANTGCAHTIPVKRRRAGMACSRGQVGKGVWKTDAGLRGKQVDEQDRYASAVHNATAYVQRPSLQRLLRRLLLLLILLLLLLVVVVV